MATMPPCSRCPIGSIPAHRGHAEPARTPRAFDATGQQVQSAGTGEGARARSRAVKDKPLRTKAVFCGAVQSSRREPLSADARHGTAGLHSADSPSGFRRRLPSSSDSVSSAAAFLALTASWRAAFFVRLGGFLVVLASAVSGSAGRFALGAQCLLSGSAASLPVAASLSSAGVFALVLFFALGGLLGLRPRSWILPALPSPGPPWKWQRPGYRPGSHRNRTSRIPPWPAFPPAISRCLIDSVTFRVFLSIADHLGVDLLADREAVRPLFAAVARQFRLSDEAESLPSPTIDFDAAVLDHLVHGAGDHRRPSSRFPAAWPKGSSLSCLMPRLMRSFSTSTSSTFTLTTSPLV